MAALAGTLLLLPSGKGAWAKEVYQQEKPENPAVKVAVKLDGKIYEFDNIEDGWNKISRKKNVEIKLYADWDIKRRIEIGGSNSRLTIDLNGHTLRRLTGSKASNGEVICVGGGGDLVIKDLPSSQGSGKGGVITGGNNKGSGGCIRVVKGSLTMNGGTIRGCSASDDGGAITIEENGTVNLTGVFFQNNSAGDSGGGIYVKKGTLTARNCAFHGNRAEKYGGAVAVNSEGTKLFDVVMQNNKADKDGGGLWVNAKKVYLSGGTIKYNMADYGAGVYVDSAYDINIQGKLVIQDNRTTSGYLSNLCLQDGWFSSAKIYSGGLLHGSKVGVNKTKSLSSSGYRAVVSTTQYQERTCYTADRGKLIMKTGKMEKVIYMASAFGEMNMAPFIIIFLELVAAAVVIVLALRKKKERMKKAEGEEGTE